MQTHGEDAWSFVARRIRAGVVIRNWTAARGYLGDDFAIHEIGPHQVQVELLPSGKRVAVSASDFGRVGTEWPAYLAGRVRRDALRDMSRCTKYVISILHQLGYEGSSSH